MIAEGKRVCDQCGRPGDLEVIARADGTPLWDYCPEHAADWRGYVEGKRMAALELMGHAAVFALEEGATGAQLGRALDEALDDHAGRQEGDR